MSSRHALNGRDELREPGIAVTPTRPLAPFTRAGRPDANTPIRRLASSSPRSPRPLRDAPYVLKKAASFLTLNNGK